MVATAATCWGMTSVAHLVVVMGTQFFDASGSGSSDYPVTDLLQMMGRASRPDIDDSGENAEGGWYKSRKNRWWQASFDKPLRLRCPAFCVT